MRVEAIKLQAGLHWTTFIRGFLAIGTALVITNLGLPQPITGPLVNALLILTVEWAGPSQAILVGMVTPLGAAMRGILPLPLMVMIPFISLANAILVGLYGSLHKRNRWLALGAAASAKALFLYGTIQVFIARPLHLELGGNKQVMVEADAFLSMMSWPQWVTAVAGGLLAFGILRIVAWRRPVN
jgi:hypothetical protein